MPTTGQSLKYATIANRAWTERAPTPMTRQNYSESEWPEHCCMEKRATHSNRSARESRRISPANLNFRQQQTSPPTRKESAGSRWRIANHKGKPKKPNALNQRQTPSKDKRTQINLNTQI